MVGNGLGAKNGILFKTAVSLEETGKTEIVVLDKTGTITSGEPRVTDLIPGEGVQEGELLSMACALEKKSEHPLAKAVLLKAEEEGLAPGTVTEFKALPGNGLTALAEGTPVYGGNLRFMETKVSVPEASQETRPLALAENGKTPLFFGSGERFLGIIAVADVIKEDSPRAVKELQNMGIRVVMLTGDNERTARAVGPGSRSGRGHCGRPSRRQGKRCAGLKGAGPGGHGRRRDQRRSGPYTGGYGHCHRSGH